MKNWPISATALSPTATSTGRARASLDPLVANSTLSHALPFKWVKLKTFKNYFVITIWNTTLISSTPICFFSSFQWPNKFIQWSWYLHRFQYYLLCTIPGIPFLRFSIFSSRLSNTPKGSKKCTTQTLLVLSPHQMLWRLFKFIN